MGTPTGKQPFWMHQIVEYLLGGALLAQGLQSPEPVAPALAGLLVLANAATVRGAAFSAFRLVSRRVHRVLDLVVIAAVVVLAVQPWIDADDGLRLVMLGIAAGLGFVWWRSSFAERARPSVATGALAGPRGAEVPASRISPGESNRLLQRGQFPAAGNCV